MQQLNILDEMQDNQVVEGLEELGLENSNWRKCKLGDLVTFQRGHDLSKTQFVSGKHPIVGSNGIIGYHNVFTTKAPGITIGRSGNLGIPQYIETDFWAHNTTLYVKEFHNSDPKFIYYLLKTLDLKSFNSGSAVPSLNRNFIHPLEVYAPKSKNDQEKIAKILSSLDDKIELNQKMNKTLEEMAQAIFKHWFIDFEFPNEEGKPYKSSGGEMVDSELGKIPKGWEVTQLSKLINIKHGYAFKGEYFTDIENENLLLSPGNFKIGGGFNNAKFKYYTGSIPSDYILNEGDLIVTMTDLSKEGDTLGYPAITPKINNKILLHNQRLGKIIIDDTSKITKYYIYWLLRNKDYRNMVLGSATGSTVKHTSPSRICEYKFALPPKVILDKFEFITNNIFLRESINLKEINTLSLLRDSLLPKLMNGEIRVNPSPNPEETHP